MRQIFRQPVAASGELTFITDFAQLRCLVMDSRRKTASFQDLRRIPPKALSLIMNYGWQVKNMFKSDGRPLGEKEIDGRQLKGFQVSWCGQLWDVWLDAETGNPHLIETWDPRGFSTVMSSFVFDREFDDSLFSLSPPKEYTVRKKAKVIRPPRKPVESDMINGLRFLARHNDNTFPHQPGLTPEIVKTLKKKAESQKGRSKAKTAPSDSPESFDRMRQFLYFYNIDWHYTGKGVKLGDADAAIFWFRPKDSKTCRVIYGDLSIKDAAEKDLPKEMPQAK